MRRLSALLLVLFLGACTPPASTPAADPIPLTVMASTSTLAPSPSLTPTLEPIPSGTPTQAETFAPIFTPVPVDVVLADFPLAVGDVWTYSVEVYYQQPGTGPDLAHWTGSVTQRVVDRSTSPEGSLVFDMEQSVEPTPPSEIWLQADRWNYIVSRSNGGVYRGQALNVYRWPLADGKEWNAYEDGEYRWKDTAAGPIDVPAGRFENCHDLRLDTLPDTTEVTLCPGIGIVKKHYAHHGDPQIEDWALTSYRPRQDNPD